MCRANELHFFQRLDATLCLSRLGRLGPESIDEVLHVGNRLLLLVLVGLLLRQALGAGFFKGRVIALI